MNWGFNPPTSVVVLKESPCARGSLRTNFQVLVLVLDTIRYDRRD